MKKKTIALLLAAVMLFGTAVGGTLAYLMDSKSVVNTFTVGQVVITLDEAKVDKDGTPIAGADRVYGNEYHLIPGQTYAKDPTVHMAAGSEEAYIRMVVTITDIANVKTAFAVKDGQYFLPQNYVTGWDPAIWNTTYAVVEDAETNTAKYEFRYYKTVKNEGTVPLNLEPLFTSLTVPGTLNNEDMALLKDMQIEVEGHAIQAAGFENADAAWAAFDAQIKK